MTSFSEWLNLKEEAPAGNDITLRGRLGQKTGGINILNRRMEQPLNRMTDRSRLTYVANMLRAVYDQVPEEQRLAVFTRDMTYLRQNFGRAIKQSAADTPPQQ